MEQEQVLIVALSERIDRLEERIAELELKQGKKQKKPPSDGVFIWEEYELLYQQRYGIKPLRNTITNTHCKMLVDRLGKDDALEVIRYYLSASDYFYVSKTHDLSLCLRDCSTLYTRAKSGKHITSAQARESELASSNKEAVNEYVKSKFFGN